jgi:Domain of unknown function (DUF4279)
MDDKPNSQPRLDGMLGFGGDRHDRKRASFRLMGDRLAPNSITQATGLIPSVAHHKGEPRPPSRSGPKPPWRSGIWCLSSDERLPGDSNHLEDHLSCLLDQLEPHAEILARVSLEQGLRADFWCGYFMGQSNSSFGLTARILARVAALDASLAFDIYGEQIETELEHWIKPR